MNRLPAKLLFCTALLATSFTPELSFAVPGAAQAARVNTSGMTGARQSQKAARASAVAEEAIVDGTATPANTPAAPACSQPTLMTGSYMGAQIGYGTYRVSNRIASPAPSSLNSNDVAAAAGWAGGVVMGHGKMLNDWFYLGGEIFIDANNFYQSFIYNDTTSIYTNQTNSGPTAGIGLLPGIKLTDSTLTYARLGWNRVYIKTLETVSGAASRNMSIARNGFVFGVGIETLIVTNYSLRGEFDHTYYNSYNTYASYNTLVRPSSNQFMMTIIYHSL